MYKKILKITAIFLFVFLLFSNSVSAQDTSTGKTTTTATVTLTPTPTPTPTPTDTDQDILELQLIQEIQDPKTGQFEYTLRVKSLVETNRLRVNWEVVNGHIKASKGYLLTDAVDLTKDQEVYITKRFIPLTPGNEEIRITAIAYGPFDDFFSFTDTSFFISKDLEVAPARSEYTMSENLLTFVKTLKFGLFATNIVLLLIIIYWRFKRWLEAD